ncbi:MAG: penicillin-binding protein 2 [Candidatus Berkelbacteria bacterium]
MDIFGNFSFLRGDKEKRVIQETEDLEFSYSDVTNEAICKIEDRSGPKSVTALKVIVVLIFCAAVLRLFFIQVVEGEANQQLAEGNRIRPRIIEANRGQIYDANGVWLARNQPSFALAVYPSDMPRNKNERLATYQKIADVAGMSFAEVQLEAEKNGLSSLDETLIKENISHDDALLLEEKIAGITGFFIAEKPIREYKVSPGLSHLIGYTGIVSEDDLKKTVGYYLSDRIGKTALELQYEEYLKGNHGVEQIEVDSKGNIVKVLVKDENKESTPGDDLMLNIDLGLQQKTAEALKAGMESGKTLTGQEVTGGAAIVMNVNTGAIISMVSLPDYNNNLFASKISTADYQTLINDPSLPMFNRSLKGTYPPGSVSKIILASGALQEGTIDKNTTLVTPAAIVIGQYTFPDWKDHSYESTNVERALAESNNVFFYSLGGGFDKIQGLGIDKIKKYWQLFGLGRKTGIDLPAEASGFLPDGAWKLAVKGEPWYIGDTYHASIGQGDLLVTPLQMVRATAVIANGGKLLQPQLVKKIVNNNGDVVKQFEPVVQSENFLNPSVIKTVAEGMRLTITDGSARNLNDLPFTVAGKTGTAQFLNNEKTHAWFECYAPYESPEIAVVVLVDGGGGGHEIAAPVAKEIMSYYFANKK